jgi:hypothetical protein
MRKASGIFLFIALATPFLALYMRTHVELRQVRKAVKHMMIDNTDRSELVLLSFSHDEVKNSLRWKHDKEFEYNEQMYDIIERRETQDSMYYWCWWDHEETRLHKQLDQLMANLLLHDPAQQSKQHTLTDFFKSLYCQQQSTPTHLTLESVSPAFPGKTLHIYLFNVLPPAPPPWVG